MSSRGAYALARRALWPRRHALGYALAPLCGRRYRKPPAYLGHKRAVTKALAAELGAAMAAAQDYEVALRRIRAWSTAPACGREVLGRQAAEVLEKHERSGRDPR